MKKTIDEIHFQTIDSTNNWAKSHRKELNPSHITCITADEQTAGRGRNRNIWHSPANENIYATFYFCLPPKKGMLYALPNLLSISCIKVLLQFQIEPLIKWPNDILIKGKKVAGILGEVITDRDQIDIILGIGINVNSPSSELSKISQPATSLLEETGRVQSRNQILCCLKEIFSKDLALFLEKGFSPFVKIYETFLREIGQEMLLGSQKARCNHVTADGRLCLKLPTGELIQTISAASLG